MSITLWRNRGILLVDRSVHLELGGLLYFIEPVFFLLLCLACGSPTPTGLTEISRLYVKVAFCLFVMDQPSCHANSPCFALESVWSVMFMDQC